MRLLRRRSMRCGIQIAGTGGQTVAREAADRVRRGRRSATVPAKRPGRHSPIVLVRFRRLDAADERQDPRVFEGVLPVAQRDPQIDARPSPVDSGSRTAVLSVPAALSSCRRPRRGTCLPVRDHHRCPLASLRPLRPAPGASVRVPVAPTSEPSGRRPCRLDHQHGARSRSKSRDQPDQRRAAPINDRAACGGSPTLPAAGSGRRAENSSQALIASATCPSPSVSAAFAGPVTKASQRKNARGRGVKSPLAQRPADLAQDPRGLRQAGCQCARDRPGRPGLVASTAGPTVSPAGSCGTGIHSGH